MQRRIKYGNQNKRGRRRHAFFSFRNEVKHRKDFDWRPTKRNPYATKKIEWSWWIKLTIACACFLTIVLVILYHPFFHIKNFEIEGLQRIDEQEFRDAVSGMLDYNKFFILPAKSYLLVSPKEMERLINSRFPIESIVVKKSFPGTLKIIIQEKISTIIYDNSKQYSYLGLGGNIVEIIRNIGEDEWKITTETVSSTLADGTVRIEEKEIERRHFPSVKKIISEMGDYPIVYDARGKEGSINDLVLKPETVTGIVLWFNLISRRTDIPFGYVYLENELSDAEIRISEGWGIKVNLYNRIEEQFSDLEYVLKEKVTRPNINYIDVRFENRVYWQ